MRGCIPGSSNVLFWKGNREKHSSSMTGVYFIINYSQALFSFLSS